MYRTAYADLPWVMPLLLGLLIAIAGPAIGELGSPRARRSWALGFAGAVLLLPLLAFVYAPLPAFLDDPDRVTFPVATGFALVAVTALLRFAPSGTVTARSDRGADIVIPALVGTFLVWTFVLGHENRRNFQTVDSVVTQTTRAVAAAGASTVLLADHTGVLGDIYLLYPPPCSARRCLRTAHQSQPPCSAHPRLSSGTRQTRREQQMPTTTRCEDVPPISPPPLRLRVVPKPGGGMLVVPG